VLGGMQCTVHGYDGPLSNLGFVQSNGQLVICKIAAVS
jgi:hypothetical protein